jgi:diguanylate cyclase (GGDEF)-like protein/PAS domain S-box-containing protein
MAFWLFTVIVVLVVLLVLSELRAIQVRRHARNREELFQIVAENAADMIALVDMKGRRLYNSPAYKKILGYSPAELGETSAFEQIHPDDRFRVLQAAREARETGVGQRLEYRIRHKNGSWLVLESVASVVRDANGDVTKLVIVNRDISERKRAEQQLEHNLFHDALTGLPNRRLFLDRLQQLFVRGRRGATAGYALLIVNIDHFKTFNETFTTAIGDQILQEIARRIGACLRDKEIAPNPALETALFRLGGDEFSILLEGINDPSDAMRIARRIQAAVADPYPIDAREVRVSISLGIALGNDTHDRPENLLKDADIALQRAKALGGSRCQVSDEAMHNQAEGRMRLESDLRTAIAERQFRIFYHPVVELASRRVVSFEALLRWEHPAQGLISPYRFLEAAEDTGLLVSIAHWLMMQTCRQLREWELNVSAGEQLGVTVNLSARQLADARLANDIQDALRETGVDPARLQLELTETVAAADPKLTVTVLSHLKHMGMGIILDDFGIGSSSLSGLRHFPVDALKIDRSLIREMQADRTVCDMVEVIIALAHKFNLRVIAEGIETARQVELLQAFGCELGQGYYFSQPLESKAALQFVRQKVAPSRGVGAGALP